MNIALANPKPSARDRVLSGAIELFATRGFQAVGLRDLASYLGLQAGSLYHHIENKQSLLFELMEAALAQLLLNTTCRVKAIRSPRKRVDLFIQTFVDFSITEKYKLTLITHEFCNLDESQKQRIIQLKNTYASLLNAIITDRYRPDATLGTHLCPVANTVIAILFGQAQWYTLDTTEPALGETLKNVVLCLVSNQPCSGANAQQRATIR